MKNKLMKKAFAYAAAAVFSAQLFTLSGAFAEGCTAEFVFSDTKITADGADGYSVDGTNLKIEKSGTYKVSGSCSDGSITVKKGVTDVNLIIDGLTLKSEETAPLTFNKGSGVTLTAYGVNTFSDTAKNNDESYADNENAENAVIKCKDGSNVLINGDGTIHITANGKNGIKSGETTDEDGKASLTLDGVTMNIDAPVNDAINAEAELFIKSGKYTISALDDAIHSDYTLTIGENGVSGTPVIDITSCEEGIEGANVYIYSGDIKVNSKDDGINGANSDLKNYNFSIDISGGNIYVNAENGDGIDSNGSLTISGGNVTVFSTSSGANSPLDSDGEFKITGGTVLAVGNSGMAQNPTQGSQNYISFGSTGSFGGGMPPRGQAGGKLPNGENEPPKDMGNPPEGMNNPPENNGRQNGSRPSMKERPQGQPFGQAGEPNQNANENSSGVSISKGDTISVSKADGTAIFTETAVRNANYVFYSSAGISENETYTLKINGTAQAEATVSQSAQQNGMTSPSENRDFPQNEKSQNSIYEYIKRLIESLFKSI